MSDLRDLYQQMILDHYRRPRNRGEMDDCTFSADGFNPLCGDRITVFVKMEEDKIADIRFVGDGCAISMASASMMTEAIKGKEEQEAEALFESFHALVAGDGLADEAEVGKLQVFGGVRDYPLRVKCATLTWHTLRAALRGTDEPVSTE
ncbi:MAG: SUF system NifU family Fe-S cluster assembly protein [Gemmatimonadetes bacterium]|nr:SUF system NifU family Fe-S cluster assembly protein [Gemmatimonadota bacterium]